MIGTMTPFTLELVPGDFAVWKLPADAPLPDEPRAELWSVTRTAQELSIVGPSSAVPTGVEVEGGWRALRVMGTLDFSLTGILAGLTRSLAASEVSVFALSTYDTDWLLVRAMALGAARSALLEAGYGIREATDDGPPPGYGGGARDP